MTTTNAQHTPISSETQPIGNRCGCLVAQQGIRYCATHKAAPALLAALEAISDALDVPRNRFGKLTFHPGGRNGEALRALAVAYKVGGAQDAAEQAVLVAHAAIRAARGA